MKKILLGTTLLSAGMFAAAAQADAPKLTVGGFADFQLGVVNEDLDTNRRGHSFRSDTELSFKVDGKTDAGLGYGGEIWLEADVEDDVDSQGSNASKTFIYFDGSWGRVEMGSNIGAQGTMKVDASNIARATGGIDGDWTYFYNNGVSSTPYIATPDLPIGYGIGGAGAVIGGTGVGFGDESLENQNKITYYTPRWSGFQLGLSYMPTVSGTSFARGQIVSPADNNAGDQESVWSAAATWDGKWDQVGIKLGATMEHGDSEAASVRDLAAWNVGGMVTWGGFAIAGSYGDWDDSGRATATAGLDNSNYWTLGGSYETGPFGVSVTYLSSDYSTSATVENEFTNLSVGADYKLAPGMTPYVEVNFISADVGGTATDDNDGTVFIVGSVLNF